MTIKEAAIILNVSPSRIRHWLREGRLVGEHHGRDWWIEESEVKRFAALPRPAGWKKGRVRK